MTSRNEATTSPFTPSRPINAHQAERYKRRAGGAVPVANSTEVARYLRKDIEQHARRTMQVEMLVAQYFIRVRDAVTPEGVAVGEASVYALIADLEAYGDGLSLAILRTLQDLATGAPSERSEAAAERLARTRLAYPSSARAVGTARALEAWAVGDEIETCLFIEFSHDDGNRHGIGVFIDQHLDGVAKHLGLTDSIWSTPEDGPFHPTEMDPLPLADAGRLLLGAVEAVDPRTGAVPAESDDFRALIAAARARAMG